MVSFTLQMNNQCHSQTLKFLKVLLSIKKVIKDDYFFKSLFFPLFKLNIYFKLNKEIFCGFTKIHL